MMTTTSFHRTILRLFAVGGVLAAGLVWSTPSEAFRMITSTSTGRVTAGNSATCNALGGFTHWNIADIDWYQKTGGQSSGKGNAIRAAIDTWTAVPNAEHTLVYRGTTSAGWSTDGQNTVMWATGNGCTGTCLALTALVLQGGQVIVESDITFNANHTWMVDGTTYDTQAVMTHELGHSLGIHHTDVVAASSPTMRATYFGSGARSLEPDDIAALQCSQNRYPVTSATGGGIPLAPANLDVAPQSCYGWNINTWTVSTGATYYELYRSSSSSFSSQSLEYSGPDTNRSVGVSGTTYFRVRACNANGCSGYRNGDQAATFYQGCPPKAV
jgi:hypothetical protein